MCNARVHVHSLMFYCTCVYFEVYFCMYICTRMFVCTFLGTCKSVTLIDSWDCVYTLYDFSQTPTCKSVNGYFV